MLWITKLLISILFTSLCLAVLPFVKYRNLLSCLKVSTLLSLFALPVSIATPLRVFVFMAGVIPLKPFRSIYGICIHICFQTVALLLPIMVEDFEIKTISHTFTQSLSCHYLMLLHLHYRNLIKFNLDTNYILRRY